MRGGVSISVSHRKKCRWVCRKCDLNRRVERMSEWMIDGWMNDWKVVVECASDDDDVGDGDVEMMTTTARRTTQSHIASAGQ